MSTGNSNHCSAGAGGVGGAVAGPVAGSVAGSVTGATVAHAYCGVVRLTEFWSRMEAHFGEAYSRSVAADYRVPELGATVNEALANGVDAKDVWRAVCAEFDVPAPLC